MNTTIIAPSRGEIWSTRDLAQHEGEGAHRNEVLIISGDVYNGVEEYPFVLVATMATASPRQPLLISAGRRTVLTDSVRRLAKADLLARVGEVTPDELAAVRSSLIRILTID